jgi:hypothetical protein
MIICTIIVLSPLFAYNPERMSTGITLDLVFTAPFLYWLAIRRSNIKKSTVARVFVAGILLAGLLLRNKPHVFLSGIKTWISPLVEAGLLFLLIQRFYKVRRGQARTGQTDLPDFLSHGRAFLGSVLGSVRMGDIVMSEIAVFYYVLPGRRQKATGDRQAFTNYKANSILLVFGVILCCFFVETAGVHFLIGIWSRTTAWIVTALGAYTTLQFYAHMRAIKRRPILIDRNFLWVRNGLAADACIPMDNIQTIEFVPPGGRRSGEEGLKMALIKGLEGHNIRIRVKAPVTVHRPFGIRQEAATLLFFADRPDDLIASVRNYLEELSAPTR